MRYCRVFVGSFILFMLSSGLVLSVAALSDDTVISSLAQAEETLSSAYEAAFDAEKAGANISILLDKLNAGGEYLAEARAWYNLGDFEKTYHFTELCNDIVTVIIDEASELSYDAKREGEVDFVVTLALSVIGAVLSVILGFFSWGVFKRRYYKRVLGSKPEALD